MADDTIVIKAPAGTKARWVRQAQREGQKLSDWIMQRMEQAVHPKGTTTTVIIPIARNNRLPEGSPVD